MRLLPGAWLLSLLGASIAAAQAPGGSPSVPFEPHNVVVIVADDVGVDLVGAYEGFFANYPNPAYPNTTPVLDYLAATGMTFRNCWTNPVCSPSRAQLLTGRHSRTSGIGTIFSLGDFRGGLQPHVETIPAVLRSPLTPFPTVTAAVGKWHLADPSQIGRHLPAHPLGPASNPWFHIYGGSIDNLTGQDFNNWQKTFGGVVHHGFDECVPPPGFSCEATVLDYATRDTADDAVHLISTLPEPFFLYVAFNAVHLPLGAPAAPLAASSCLGGAVMGSPACTSSFDNTDVPRDTRCMMQWMDNEIGRIVCAIESAQTAPKHPTTLIFTSDNGSRGSKSDFKLGAIVPPFNPKHGKGTLYEGGVNVPLIVKSPLIPPPLRGSAHDALVGSTDLFATVLELMHAPLPLDRHGVRDTISFVPYLLGASGSRRAHLYAEMLGKNFVPDAAGNPPASFTLDKHLRAVRDKAGHKLIQVVTKDGQGGFVFQEELYDLANDPHEANDLIGQIGQAPYSGWYQDLRHQLDVTWPHMVTP